MRRVLYWARRVFARWAGIREPWEAAMSRVSVVQPEAFERLVQGVGYCVGAGVVGHIAEFGTMTGGTAAVLAQALRHYTTMWRHSDRAHQVPSRLLYLFDSFEGLPGAMHAVDASSPHVLSGLWGVGACKGLSKSELLSLCARHLPQERIRIFDGWFDETLPTVEAGTKFALVHVDSDRYQSAWHVLDGLFSRDLVADGCAIFFDDWNCNRASPRFGERRAWQECVAKYGVLYSDCGDYGLFGHRFIVHRA